MKSTTRGQQAEETAAKHLAARGWKIIDRNWRTKVCEIDIIAQKDGVVYFVEVKYRASPSQGDGLAYITPAKLKKMHFAAGIWTASHDWIGDQRLLAVSVSAAVNGYKIEEVVELD